MIPVDINKGIEDVGKIVDDVISTEEEKDIQLTERLKTDMTSRYWLPQNIRPIIALSLLLTLLGLTISMVLGYKVDQEAWYTIGALNATAISFYFSSRKQEKIQMAKMKADVQKAEAAIKIEEQRTKAQIVAERKAARAEKNARKRAEKNKN